LPIIFKIMIMRYKKRKPRQPARTQPKTKETVDLTSVGVKGERDRFPRGWMTHYDGVP